MDYKWLSSKDAADKIGVLPRTLYGMIDRGEIPAYRFGRVIRLKTDDVEAFVERSRIQPGSLGYLQGHPDESNKEARQTV